MELLGKTTESVAILALLCSISVILTQEIEPKMADIKALSDTLLKNFSKYTVPQMDPGQFNMTVYVALLAVGDIDEIQEKVSTIMNLYLYWNDENIKWNKTEKGIKYLFLGWVDVWKPIFRVGNPHTEEDSRKMERSYDTVLYTSNGDAYYVEMKTTRTTCHLDMIYFPFDIQSCDIKMMMEGFQSHQFNIDAAVYKHFDKSAANHGSWTLLSQEIESAYFSVTIHLEFERRPLFILLNILLPIIVLAMLTPIVFVLPKKSGERVGYAVTMLLAISVYMTIVSNHLPQHSKPIPLVFIMIFVWYMLDALIVFVVIINTNIYTTKDSKSVPYMSRKFVLLTRKLTCQGSKKISGGDSQEETQKCLDVENLNGKDEPNKASESAENSYNPVAVVKITWRDLSHAIDKWCFVIAYLLKVALPVIFFSVTKTQGNKVAE